MDEFGDTPTIYVWPTDHVEGQPFPEDFWDKVRTALKLADIDWETA